VEKAKLVATPLTCHFSRSSKQSPTTEIEKEVIKKVSYASVVGSLMYAMVCARADKTHAVGVVGIFLANLGKEH
jgi:ATP-binding cassette subfamily B (MDR/TAP) protein 1